MTARWPEARVHPLELALLIGKQPRHSVSMRALAATRSVTSMFAHMAAIGFPPLGLRRHMRCPRVVAGLTAARPQKRQSNGGDFLARRISRSMTSERKHVGVRWCRTLPIPGCSNTSTASKPKRLGGAAVPFLDVADGIESEAGDWHAVEKLFESPWRQNSRF